MCMCLVVCGKVYLWRSEFNFLALRFSPFIMWFQGTELMSSGPAGPMETSHWTKGSPLKE